MILTTGNTARCSSCVSYKSNLRATTKNEPNAQFLVVKLVVKQIIAI